MKPCKSFGHTEGRYPSNGGCKACSNLRARINFFMWYWGNRIIRGIPANASAPYTHRVMLYHYKNVWRRRVSDEREATQYEETYGHQ